MRRPRYLDLVCPVCETRHERFCETNDDNTPIDPEVCNKTHDGVMTCDGVLVFDFAGNAPLMAPLAGKDVKTNLDDAQRQRERLEKRSSEHFFRNRGGAEGGRDEAIERERSMLKKNGMEGAGGVK